MAICQLGGMCTLAILCALPVLEAEAMGKNLVKFERLNDQPNNIGIKIVYNPNGLDSPLSRNDQIGKFYCPCNRVGPTLRHVNGSP